MLDLINSTRLSSTDLQIAVGRLVWRSEWADIAAALNKDRTTASKRLRRYIVPLLMQMLEQTKASA